MNHEQAVRHMALEQINIGGSLRDEQVQPASGARCAKSLPRGEC
jgi:hypothetical protein